MLTIIVLVMLGFPIYNLHSDHIQSSDGAPLTIPPIITAQESEVKTWHHDCSNTTGFEYMDFLSERVSWSYTEIDLESDGESVYVQNIERAGNEGPVFVLPLPDVFPLSGLRNFSVSLTAGNSAFRDTGRVDLFSMDFIPFLSTEMRYVGTATGYEHRVVLRYVSREPLLMYELDNVRAFNPYHVWGSGPELFTYAHDYTNITLSARFDSSQGVNGSLWKDGSLTHDKRFVRPEVIDNSRDISHVVLMFGGAQDFRVHDIRVDYETGGESDMTPISIDSPPDFLYQIGQTGNTITWNCSDDNPRRYWITKNRYPYLSLDNIIEEGIWNGSPIILSVDDLLLGNSTFLLIVQDWGGFFAWDMVTVMVIEHPVISFIKSNVLILGSALFVTVACIILYWTDKRGKPPVSHSLSFIYD